MEMTCSAHQTVQLLQQESPDFILPDMSLPNSPVYYTIWGLM